MSLRLLIAESDTAMAESYESFFSREGFAVETAGDGLDCLTRVSRSMPDVMVLEYELPWGGGDGVLARFREESPLLPIAVVLVTCDNSPEDLSHEFTPPVVGCLQMPFRLHELLEMVREITDGQPRVQTPESRYMLAEE